MTRKRMAALLLWVVAMAPLTGCMPKMTIEDLKAMKPQRPAELDRLDAFVGTWESTGECTMAGLDETVKARMTETYRWDGDGWYLVSSGMFSMDEMGDMKGTGVWMYDSKAKKYRMSWVDSMGGMAVGESRYDEKKDTWTMKGSGYGPMGKTTSKAWFKFVDPDTMEWEWSEYGMGGLMKIMSMKGTSRRK